MSTSKRVFDILVAIIFLVVLLPVMLIIAIAIKLTSKGPIIYQQERTGLNNSKFTFYKFRSMHDRAEERNLANMVHNPFFKMKNDPRVTPVGRVIRKWCLDEIPQLINVLKGDMSIVGPRPLMPEHMEKCVKEYRECEIRLAVKPGMTSLRQISGRYSLTCEQSVKLDLKYVNRHSLWLDTKILLKSLLMALKGPGW